MDFETALPLISREFAIADRWIRVEGRPGGDSLWLTISHPDGQFTSLGSVRDVLGGPPRLVVNPSEADWAGPGTLSARQIARMAVGCFAEATAAVAR